jgi:hypothetical protein
MGVMTTDTGSTILAVSPLHLLSSRAMTLNYPRRHVSQSSLQEGSFQLLPETCVMFPFAPGHNLWEHLYAHKGLIELSSTDLIRVSESCLPLTDLYTRDSNGS